MAGIIEFIRLRVKRVESFAPDWYTAGVPLQRVTYDKELTFRDKESFLAYLEGIKQMCEINGFEYDYKGYDSELDAELVVVKKLKS